jgi:hypothetical protein
MATAKLIQVPEFDFSAFYYPDIYRLLLQYKRQNVPEVTDESDFEPFIQILKAYALTGHLNNVLLDVVANETLLPTARLLESVRSHLKLIDRKLRQASPASTDVILEFSKVFTVPTSIVPINSQFATVETEENPQIIFETNHSFIVSPTNAPTGIFIFTAGKIKLLNNSFAAGDKVVVAGIDFRFGIEWVAGGTLAATLLNICNAINLSGSDNIKGRIHATHDGIDTISLIPLAHGIESIPVTFLDTGTTNFEVASGGFGLNRSSVATTPGVFFDLFDGVPKAGDAVYVLHADIMWDTFEFEFNSSGSGIDGVWEFFDGTFDDAKPDDVINLGSNLEFDLTTLLGTQDRRGSVIRVVLTSSGASEIIVSEFVSGKNIARSQGLFGQSVITTDEHAYVVGTLWNEVAGLTDETVGFVENGKISFALPQSQSQNWIKTSINALTGHWLRFRVTKVASPVNPNVDQLRIDTGNQYLLVPVVQGQTVAENPLGSSNGSPGQEFRLTFKPVIEGTLQIEVNEGSGFQVWNLVDNFLSSTSVSKDYTLEIKGDDTAIVRFGDGETGKIPTPGVDNIRAIYRIGADKDGNVGAGTISVNKSAISFINRVFNPRQASGFTVKEGSTPKDLARLKIEGPASIRTLGRGITTDDFQFLATQFATPDGSRLVSRALAIEETFGVKTIELVVVGLGGILLTEAQRDQLGDYFNGNKALGIKPTILTNHEVTIVNYSPRFINVDATVTGGNAEKIKNAVAALLNPDATFDDGVTKRWAFGQEIPFTVIISEIFEVDPTAIKKVVMNTPTADIQLGTRELPLAGSINITVI